MPNDGLTLWGFFPCRTDALDAVKKLNEWTSAGRTSSSAKQLLKEISKKSFAWAKDRFFYKLVNELRVNPDTYGRAKKKNCGFKNVRIMNVSSLKWSPLIIFYDFRVPPPPPHLPCLYFPRKFERSPFWILPKFSSTPPSGFSVRTVPPFYSPKNQVIPLKILPLPPRW